jgi:superfamily II DNA or RNA helicase
MSEIIVRGSQCSIIGIPNEINAQLEAQFSYESAAKSYSKKIATGEWDGRMYCYRDRHFSIGLLHDVVATLKSKEIAPQIKVFTQLGEKITIPSGIVSFRPFQETIVDTAISYKQASAEVATGGGKTRIIGEYIRRLGMKTLVITPSVEILSQMEKMLSEQLHIPIGVIGGKEKFPEFVTVATWQSLNEQWSDYLNDIDVLVVDEAQHLGAPVLREIAKKIPATYRLALSGTLFREDGADIEITSACGPKIASYSYSYLTEKGYLVPAKFLFLRTNHTKYPYWMTYQDVYNDYVLNNEYRNHAIIDIASKLSKNGRKVLIFVARIEHGKELARVSGIQFLHSTSKSRDKLISDFKSNGINSLISTSVLNEGFDCPPIDAVVLGAPHKSLILTLQRIGRALRTHEGKKNAIIVDVADNCNHLQEHFQRRLAKYKQEKAWTMLSTIDSTKPYELSPDCTFILHGESGW